MTFASRLSLDQPVRQEKVRVRKANVANWVGLLAATAIFIAVGAGVLWGVQRFIADARHVAHTHEVIASVDAFEARLRDAESAQRGYLLTSQVDYLVAYRSNQAQLQPLLDRLQRLVADNPAQRARVQKMQQLEALREQQIHGNLERYRRGGLEEARSGIDEQVLVVSSQIRLVAQQLIAAERELLDLRDRSSQRSALSLRALALVGIPLGIVLLGLVYLRLWRETRWRARAERRNEAAANRLQQSLAESEGQRAGLAELTAYAGLLQNCISADEAVALTTRLLGRLLPGSGGTVYRIRASRDYAEQLAQWGRHVVDSQTLVAPADCWALRRGQIHFNTADEDAARCAHLAPAMPGNTGQLACIPLTAQGVQLGFIYISSAGSAVTARMALVQAAADQLSMTLHTLSLQEKLRVQSIRDPLSGLFNRRYLEESLVRELARCQRRDLPFSVLMLDVDHFKHFNDTHGHPGGDALLAALGKLLQAQVRAEDIACRYGGEEFTVLLPEAGAEQARQRAEQLLQAIRSLRVEHMGHELPAVTASIGIAVAGRDGAEHLLQRADQALYRAKHEGRNRVVVDGQGQASAGGLDGGCNR
jgi:diguanylate cyclase (GGDEF)-like protein